MSERETATIPTGQIDEATRRLDRSLRRLGLAAGERRTVVDDVRADLHAAASDGVSPAEVIGPDVDAFARQTVEAVGYPVRPDAYAKTVVLGSLAAVVAVPAAYLLFMQILHPLFTDWFTLDRRYPTAGPVVAFTVMVLIASVVVLLALHGALAGRPAVRETLVRAAVLVPLAGGVGIASAFAVVGRPGFTTSEAAVLTQVLPPGVVALVAALGASRWWALRATKPQRADSSTRTP